MTVGLPSGRGISSELGAAAPTLGTPATSFFSGDLRDSISAQKPLWRCGALALALAPVFSAESVILSLTKMKEKYD